TKPLQVTFHKDDAVRRARISSSGEWIVYECGFDLWVASTQEGSPARKLAIEVNADDKKNLEEEQTFTNGIAEYALAADDGYVACVIHGQIWGRPMPSGKPVRLTTSAA